jgi:hypothetical protein
MSVEQSGNVTRNHLAKFVTSGVIADAGPQVAGQRVLATLFNADFNSTNDQPLVVQSAVQVFQLTGLIITNATRSLTAAIGGFYSAASKGGSAIVSAGQVYTVLTGPNLLMQATLTTFANSARFSAALLTANQIFFSLSTPQGVVANADIYAIGVDLTPGSTP